MSEDIADTEADAPILEDAAPEPDAVELEAIAMGWKPQSEFKGPTDKFVSAADYVERGKTIMPFLRNELSKRDREIEGLKKANTAAIQHMSRAEERAYTRAKAEIEADLAYAKANNDVEGVEAAATARAELERQVPAASPDEPPEFTAWKAENPWFGADKALTAACIALGNEVFDEGYTGKAQAKEVDRRLREQFPDKFADKSKPATNPNRSLPGAVEGGSGPARRGGKAFSDMPADAQAMCQDFERTIKGFKREAYVKTFFEGQTK